MAQYDFSTGQIPKPQTKRIWRVFWILLAATALEFLIAFTMPANLFRVGIFVILTIFKAFYIVAEFMHLKHEVKVMAYAIVLPMLVVVWLVVALIVEGGAIFLSH